MFEVKMGSKDHVWYEITFFAETWEEAAELMTIAIRHNKKCQITTLEEEDF